MKNNDIIINRIANSPLITLDLESYIPSDNHTAIDLKNLLFEGLILREKDFREFINSHDWEKYQDQNVAIHCSTDAVIPSWAYMLITSKLQPFAKTIHFGTPDELRDILIKNTISNIDTESYRDKKVVIKGCSKEKVPESAYIEITRLLTPVVSSIMYGEPCSTVPIYKRKK